MIELYRRCRQRFQSCIGDVDRDDKASCIGDVDRDDKAV